MDIDLDAAEAFVATHARNLDRRRLELALGKSGPDAVLAALDGYRNPDGGYGWGLEPDLRSAESQPAGAYHAFEVLAEVAPATTRHSVELCDWLASVSLPDGGLPFSLPIGNPAGCALWWLGSDPNASALQISAAVIAQAHRVARSDRSVAGHPWLTSARAYCLEAIRGLDRDPGAYELLFIVHALDAISDFDPGAADLLQSVRRYFPADGVVPVTEGREDEKLHPLEFAPESGRPARGIFAPETIEGDLERLAREQKDDGGWPWEAQTFSPASALEWRGYETVRAVSTLRVGLP